MVRDVEAVDLEEERNRLRDERGELADRIAELGADYDEAEGIGADASTEVREAWTRGNQLDSWINALEWAIEEYDEPTVSVGGLTTGEHGRVGDRVADARSEQVGRGTEPSMAGVTRIFWVAMGTVEAPFFDDGAGFEGRVAAVRELPPELTSWLEHRINEKTTVGADTGKSFADLVRERGSREPAQAN